MGVQQWTKLDDLLSKIKEVAAAEYQRGVQESLTRILGVAQRDTINGFGKARTPRGAARALVEAMLKSGPKTIREIREGARTDTEKMISYQTVRLELERGKKNKRYKSQNGRWAFSRVAG
jgi:hypothetical protein